MERMLVCLLALILCFGACAYAEDGWAQANERTEAAEFKYELAEGDDLYVFDLVFNDTVTVSGDYGQIMFANCEFNGDIVNAAEFATRVIIMDNCVVNGKCILRNGMQEATVDTPFPKFMSFVPVEVACEECYGSAIAFGDMQLVFNGDAYTAADSNLFFDCSNPDAGIVAYTGQESSYFVVGQWWENGEKTMIVECEYDPTM